MCVREREREERNGSLAVVSVCRHTSVHILIGELSVNNVVISGLGWTVPLANHLGYTGGLDRMNLTTGNIIINHQHT